MRLILLVGLSQLSVALLLSSCGSKQSFQGKPKETIAQDGEDEFGEAENASKNKSASNSKEGARAPAGEDGSAVAIDLPKTAPNCNAEAVALTKAKLLTTGISRIKTQQFIRYELSLVSCADGSVLTLDKQAVLFDLNVTIDPLDSPILYKVYSPTTNALLVDGVLTSVFGSDLFGRKGAYTHWETATFSFNNKEPSIIVEFEIPNARLNSEVLNAPTSDSFLKIGAADPVQQTIKWE